MSLAGVGRSRWRCGSMILTVRVAGGGEAERFGARVQTEDQRAPGGPARANFAVAAQRRHTQESRVGLKDPEA